MSEWLRVRVENKNASLNFKRWHPLYQAIKTDADECESTVDDPAQVGMILDALGFKQLGTIDQPRQAWHLDDTEIAFDTMEGLGTFVEFEFTGQADSVEAATTQLDLLIAGFGLDLGDQIHAGYPHFVLGIASA